MCVPQDTLEFREKYDCPTTGLLFPVEINYSSVKPLGTTYPNATFKINLAQNFEQPHQVSEACELNSGGRLPKYIHKRWFGFVCARPL